jgi:hypothetical protein
MEKDGKGVIHRQGARKLRSYEGFSANTFSGMPMIY